MWLCPLQKKAELTLKPAVAVEFVTQLGVQIPEFSKHAVLMNTNIYHESGIQARVSVNNGQFKFSVPAPTTPVKLFSIKWVTDKKAYFIACLAI